MTDLAKLQFALAQSLTRNSVNESALIENLSADELERSAETLIRKRLSYIHYFLPRSVEAICRSTEPIENLRNEYHFSGPHAPALDAIAFAKWLATEEVVADWIAELAIWESLALKWYEGSRSVQIVRFRYDVMGWRADVENAECPQVRRSIWIVCRMWQRFLVKRVY
jgi:hypothetical protein